jgi:hypothetical protein
MTNTHSPEKTGLSDPQKEHVIREWEKLNKELEKLMAETRSREKFSITIIAGVASWALVHAHTATEPLPPDALYIISWIPLISTLLFAISVFTLYRNIIWIGDYLAKIEDYFLGDNDFSFGWEKYFTKTNKRHLFVGTTIIIWAVQLVFAILFHCHLSPCTL